MTELSTATALTEAIALAERSFPPDDRPEDYRLIQAELQLGSQVWRLTFKRARLLPDSAEDPIGAGGELFFTVDLAGRSATYTGGE
ncbi:hypothetical protein [Jidongwangia harbinensis]|uniref:hypothetical protein n=1 Tax=Jidongwangia harbinensis TaxID=2878561 RepID=UPI001CD9CDF6|nr:hypothetical protein [Jidongwangia harbinensis]MCA2218930.1 hypothetical protein [Jidongwangia harbinensis]